MDTDAIKEKGKAMDIDAIREEKEIRDDKEKFERCFSVKR